MRGEGVPSPLVPLDDDMETPTCPRCGSAEVVTRIVNDQFHACDADGRVFEVRLREPVWACPACRMCWEGEEASAAKELAYLAALQQRKAAQPSR